MKHPGGVVQFGKQQSVSPTGLWQVCAKQLRDGTSPGLALIESVALTRTLTFGFVLTASVALALTVSVAAAQTTAYNWRGRVERQNNTVIVHNPDVPLIAADQLGVDLLWRAPTADEFRTKGLWAEPGSIRITAEGLFVADRRVNKIYKLAPTGAWTHTIGKPGEGPGELTNIGAFAILQGEMLVPNNARMEVFSVKDGSYIRSQRLPAVTFGIDSYDSGSILLRTISGYQRLKADGRVSPFRFFADSLNAAGLPNGELRQCSLGTNSNWVRRVVDCFRPIFSIRSETALERIVMIERDTVRASAAENEECRKRQVIGVDRATLRPEALAFLEKALAGCSVRHDIRGLAVDDVTGVMLLHVQNPNPTANGRATINVFSRDGVYLATHTFAESWSSFAIYNSQIAALVPNDSTGEVSVVSYRLTIPAAAIQFAERAVR